MIAAMIIFGVLTVLSAAGVVLSQKPLNSALCLVATFFFVGVHYALLGADFLAALQVLIYGGAIMVLVVFVIMLLGLNQGVEGSGPSLPSYVGALFCGVFIGIFVFILSKDAVLPIASGVSGAGFDGSPKAVGLTLVKDYVFPFELSALLLLAAIIGAVLLAYEPRRPLEPGRGLSAMRTDSARDGGGE